MMVPGSTPPNTDPAFLPLVVLVLALLTGFVSGMPGL